MVVVVVVVKSRWGQQWRWRALWNTSNKVDLVFKQARRHERVWNIGTVPQQYMQPSGLTSEENTPSFHSKFRGPHSLCGLSGEIDGNNSSVVQLTN